MVCMSAVGPRSGVASEGLALDLTTSRTEWKRGAGRGPRAARRAVVELEDEEGVLSVVQPACRARARSLATPQCGK
eukprot:5060893-Alexandrium_andersonii.AAC.1